MSRADVILAWAAGRKILLHQDSVDALSEEILSLREHLAYGKISGNSIEYYRAVMRKAGDPEQELTKEEKEIVEFVRNCPSYNTLFKS